MYLILPLGLRPLAGDFCCGFCYTTQAMKPERTIILIDGSNFYFKLKDLGLNTLNFHFSDFVKLLAGKRKLVQSMYFVGEVRTDGTAHAQKLYNNQQRLPARLKNHGVR